MGEGVGLIALETSKGVLELHLLMLLSYVSWKRYMYVKYHFFICAMLTYTKPIPVPHSFKEQTAAFYTFPHPGQGGSSAARDTFAQ